ncbi:hypothetical protein PAXRUDRAFT_791753 [Paxillus rubicundulus Ve08.2h10]|uniref:Unplaced genomic scaffold scaffold_4286, whole genome shotgun sequence n=1 Tax=Paxillus rubicundulus Ve08.2h10 TaxID=930991 RepID=A0A0D0D2L6_9AGAM|nr:hypothetical protein PAXRUDRAFT_791753 [Paxillus rubicundulus Ve08.2h10]
MLILTLIPLFLNWMLLHISELSEQGLWFSLSQPCHENYGNDQNWNLTSMTTPMHFLENGLRLSQALRWRRHWFFGSDTWRTRVKH